MRICRIDDYVSDFTMVSLARPALAASSSSVMSMARLKAWVSEVLNQWCGALYFKGLAG